MRKIVVRAGGVELVQVPEPILGPGQVLVQTNFSLISTGTERNAVAVHSQTVSDKLMKNPSLAVLAVKKLLRGEALRSYRKVKQKSRTPKSLGYSLSGKVLAVGDGIQGIMPGSLVACGGTQGAHHAEFACVSGLLCVNLESSQQLQDAAFVSVGAIGVHALRRANMGFGETVAVIGLGLVGALTARIAQISGYRVLGVEIQPNRLELARQMGLEVFEPDQLANNVADAVLVCTAGGGRSVMNKAADLARPGGRVVVVGGLDVSVDRAKIYSKELDLLISTSYGPGRYDPVYEEKGLDYPIKYVRWTQRRNMDYFISLLKDGFSPTEELKVPVVPIEEAPKAYKMLAQPNAPLAFLISYQTEEKPASVPAVKKSPGKSTGPVSVALVGPGKFARNTHLPMIKASKDFQLRYIVSSSPEKALGVAEEFGARAASLESALEDPELELVMITTRHANHAQLAIKALQAGKAVFVEKPLALNPDELDKLTKVQAETKGIVVVGFNRRYSPLSQKLRAFVEQNRPATVLYRINAGALPEGHWLLDPDVGGGRLRGEACHFFDYLVFLLGQDFTLVNGLGSPNEFSGTVVWPDGSMGTVLYSGRGSRLMPKERIEVFAGQTSAVLDDFKQLSLFKSSEPETLSLKEQDKGFKQQLQRLFNLLRDQEPVPVDFQEALSSTYLTLAASQDILHGPGGDRD